MGRRIKLVRGKTGGVGRDQFVENGFHSPFYEEFRFYVAGNISSIPTLFLPWHAVTKL